MIDNVKSNICGRGGGGREGANAILLRNCRRDLNLVLQCVTEERRESGKRQNWCYVTIE